MTGQTNPIYWAMQNFDANVVSSRLHRVEDYTRRGNQVRFLGYLDPFGKVPFPLRPFLLRLREFFELLVELDDVDDCITYTQQD